MSRQLTDQEAIRLIKENPDARMRYDWNEWLDGNWHYVFKHVDYACSDVSFRNLLYTQVKHVGSIKTVKMEDGFLIKKVGRGCI
jgi:hypothetical protein